VVYDPVLGFGDNVAIHPTARYWLLWPGIALMVASTFAELACRWRMLYDGLRSAVISLIRRLKRFLSKKQEPSIRPVSVSIKSASGKSFKTSIVVEEDDDDDAIVDLDGDRITDVPLSEQVPTLWWSTGLSIATVVTVLVLQLAWSIPFYETLVSILLGFILAFISIQSAGLTDINPSGALAKTSQIFLAAFPPTNPTTHMELAAKQTTNIAAGLISASSASQSTDMVGDLKTGFLLGVSPRQQFLAQVFGSLVSVFTGLGFWVLFSKAYPCITNSKFDGQESCPFTLQQATAWQGVTIALTMKNAVPESAALASLIAAIIAIVVTVLKHNYVPANKRHWIPTLNAVGVAFVSPDMGLINCVLFGGVVGWLWNKRYPGSYKNFMFSVAAGLIAGEGVSGISSAIFALFKVHPLTNWGIPPYMTAAGSISS